MNDFLQLVFSFLLVLGPLVILHELGHFWFAKRAGIRVLEFGLGFPPRARKLWRGMGKLKVGSTWVHTPRNFKYPAKLSEGVHVQAQAVESKGRLMLTSITVVEDDAAHPSAPAPTPSAAGGAIQLCGEVLHFDPGTEYTLNWLPIGGFVRMLGEEDPTALDSFAAAPKRWRSAVLLAGPGMNIVAAVVIFSIAFMAGQLVAETYDVTIGTVAPGSPAEQAGLASAMTVLAIEGTPVNHPDELINYTNRHLGETIQLTVRDAANQVRDIEVFARPDGQRPAGQGPMGITINARGRTFSKVYQPLPEAVNSGLSATWNAVQNMVTLPSLLLSGQLEPQQARPVGPYGIGQMASYALEESIDQGVLFPLLQMAGVISIALAVTNLLPLPALDGGRLVFVLIEAVRGKRISPEKEALVHFAGMMVLLAIALLITIQDITNPIQNPF